MTSGQRDLLTPQNNQAFWQVAVNAPLEECLTYAWDSSFEIDAQPGVRVEVPLGKRKVKGTLIAPQQEADTEFKIKSISSIDEDQIKLPEVELK